MFSRGAYFIGKCVWAKGYLELMYVVGDFNEKYVKSVKECLEMDVYGDGDDFVDVKVVVVEKVLSLSLFGRLDYANEKIFDYKVFINLLLFDVVVMMFVEVLVMGKFVVCVEYLSNVFFVMFLNCRTYFNMDEFVKCIREVIMLMLKLMMDDEIYCLMWEVVIECLLDVVVFCDEMKYMMKFYFADWFSARFYYVVTKSEVVRCLIGGGVGIFVLLDNFVDWFFDVWGGGLMDCKLF